MAAIDSFGVRKATVDDVNIAADLLLLAAGNLLVPLFGEGDKGATLAFLKHAWAEGGGQYGFEQHWIATRGSLAVGMITAWESKMPIQFTQHTLQALNSFYGVHQAATICARSQLITKDIQAPSKNDYVLGHFAVRQSFQNLGVGSQLLQFMEHQAVEKGKRNCLLDVEVHNTDAIAFYAKRGYRQVNKHAESSIVRMEKRIN